MLESDFVTQCPKCETTFRVTETQLAAAHGAVRCGACLQVFAANDHLVHPEPTLNETTVTESAVPESFVTESSPPLGALPVDVLPTDVLAVDSPNVENDNLGGGKLFEADIPISSPSHSIDLPESALRVAQVEPSESVSEMQSDPLVDQVPTHSVENAGKTIFGVDYFVTPGISETITEAEQIEDLESEQTEALNESQFAQPLDRTEVVNISGPDDAALEALFEELKNDSVTVPQSELEVPLSKHVATDVLDLYSGEEDADDLSPKEVLAPNDPSDGDIENELNINFVETAPFTELEIDSQSVEKEVKLVVDLQEADLQEAEVHEVSIQAQDFDSPSERVTPAIAEVMLSNLDDDQSGSPDLVPNINLESEIPETIVGDYQEPVKSHNLSWFLGAVLLVVVLVGQYAYVNIELLVQHPKLRPYYALFCNYADCTLPAFEDVTSIKTTELVVRVHPEIERALLVDAIIRNTSIYRQAFPTLEMKFTGLNNLVTASRLFQPKEYLGGEMLGLKFIPARTEVRLGLEIVDPGENAFGYSLEAIQPK